MQLRPSAEKQWVETPGPSRSFPCRVRGRSTRYRQHPKVRTTCGLRCMHVEDVQEITAGCVGRDHFARYMPQQTLHRSSTMDERLPQGSCWTVLQGHFGFANWSGKKSVRVKPYVLNKYLPGLSNEIGQVGLSARAPATATETHARRSLIDRLHGRPCRLFFIPVAPSIFAVGVGRLAGRHGLGGRVSSRSLTPAGRATHCSVSLASSLVFPGCMNDGDAP